VPSGSVRFEICDPDTRVSLNENPGPNLTYCGAGLTSVWGTPNQTTSHLDHPDARSLPPPLCSALLPRVFEDAVRDGVPVLDTLRRAATDAGRTLGRTTPDARESPRVGVRDLVPWRPASAVSAMLGHGEQHGGVFERFEGVPGVGHDEEIPGGAFPADVPRAEPHPPVQHVHASPGLS
jgi:hypothetical protein